MPVLSIAVGTRINLGKDFMTSGAKRLIAGMILLGLAGCQSTETSNPTDDRFNEASFLLMNATGLESPGVQRELDWFRQPGARVANFAWLAYRGTHPDILIALADIWGPDQIYFDRYQRLYHDYLFNTPYVDGNAFQIAVAASRPDLAQQIAVHFARKKGDYRDGVPLGQIPSVRAMAEQTASRSYRHFQTLSADDSMWSDFYHDMASMDRINAQPPGTYTRPAGRGLLFRFAASQRPGWGYDTVRQYGPMTDDLMERLASPTTMTDVDYRNDLAADYEKELTRRAIQTVQFIQTNFGGDPNERLPYCMMRDGEPAIVCPTVSPVHLAARNSTMRDAVQKLEWQLLPAGKLQALVVAGGNPNLPDNYGVNALAYAQNGGQHPGANPPGGDFDLGQLMAGASILAGSAFLAGEGGEQIAAELFVNGMTDVITGDTNNLVQMNQQMLEQSKQSAPGGQASAGTAGGAQVATDQYAFTCPETGRTHSVPIAAKSQSCRRAMERYAKVAGCNMIDEMESAQNAYYSACASEM